MTIWPLRFLPNSMRAWRARFLPKWTRAARLASPTRWPVLSILQTERNPEMKLWRVIPAALLLAGCAGDFTEVGREPKMSPVGTGLSTDVRPTAAALFVPQQSTHSQSLWNGSRTDLFSDQRASKIGDVITVLIAI